LPNTGTVGGPGILFISFLSFPYIYIYMYKEAEECMNYLPLKITIFIRIISHCTQLSLNVYKKYLSIAKHRDCRGSWNLVYFFSQFSILKVP
jgi:hypothetical protein